MRLALGSALVAALMFTGPSTASASTIKIDFEAFSDLDSLDSLSPINTGVGTVSFTNSLVLVSGAALGSLNELEFPPKAGIAVAADFGGPMDIVFGSPLFRVGGYFNYNTSLTFDAYNGLNLLGSRSSLFSNNLALTGKVGSKVNELIEFSSLLGITSVRITGGPQGGSFTLDDLTLTNDFPRQGSPVPEPSTFVLMLGGAAAAFIGKRRKDARRNNL